VKKYSSDRDTTLALCWWP